LRPDVVVAALRPGRRGFAYGSEVAWLPAAVGAGATVLAEVNHGLPAASGEPELPRDQVVVIAEVDRPPHQVAPAQMDDDMHTIGRHVASLIPAGSAIQFGPGKIAEAAIAALDVPVHVDSGVISEPVVDLEDRGLLLGDPTGTYLVGSDRLYRWADKRPVLRRIEHTHDMTRLSCRPIVAINTALEVDRAGSVNVERIGGQTLGGVGGHADYAAAAARAPTGLSVLALPTVRGGATTLVDALSAPASTAYADIDVMVTEHGIADLRTLDPQERTAAIAQLWQAGEGTAR
jgi:acyl-CoA hydrolase